MVPRVHPGARGWTYRVRRPARNHAVVVRLQPDGARKTLLDSTRLSRVDWSEVARRILDDALVEAPVRKLALDFGHFLSLHRGETREISASELETWLATWSLPSLPGETQSAGRR